MKLLAGLALPRRDWALVAAGAVLLALAYPPFHLFLPSFVCVAPVVWLIAAGQSDPRPIRRQLAQGFWYGLLSQGLVLYWMVIALWHFTPLSGLGYAATILILALYHAMLFAVAGQIMRRTGLSIVVVLPLLWTALEWWVGHQGDVRFPWLGLGTSLTGYPTVVQIADVVGARGVTFLLVLANTVLATAWLARARPRAPLRLAAVSVGVLAALGYGTWRERTILVRPAGTVALVQPNIGFQEKWDPDLRRGIFDGLLALTDTAFARGEPDLVLWPEASIPQYFPYPPWEREIGAVARARRTPLFVGGLDWQPTGPTREDYDYWNAAFLFDSTGSRAAYPVYHKRYLVPITERVPFVNPRWFKLRFFGGFAVGEPGAVYEVGLGRFGALICYESAFEDLARRYRARGADFVVNITNDAWFGETSAPRQHLAHLVMRAIENRVGVARAANTGISGFVDPVGRVSGRTRLGERTVTLGTLEVTDMHTVYTRFGDWVGLLSLVGTAVLVGGMVLRKP
ncbi:MAG: apolipoprotein N-acyltransferase [Gemmatimonadota bacterium]|nr:apolipoprotein N-acyltransferase [Gemmatimonadota bacterium]